MKKVGKTTRPFRYDLNQIPYDYTVEVRNRFKGLDLIECLMIYGQRFITLYRKQGSRVSPRKRNPKKLNGLLRQPFSFFAFLFLGDGLDPCLLYNVTDLCS